MRAPESWKRTATSASRCPTTPLATPAEAILGFLTKQNQITNKQVRDLTGIKSENQVKMEFYKLRDEGLLEPVPELKGSKSA